MFVDIEEEIHVTNDFEENKKIRIDDSHEDSKHFIDEDDFDNQRRSSFKEEFKTLKDSYSKVVKDLLHSKDVKMSVLDLSTEEGKAEANKIDAEYAELLAKEQEKFDHKKARLKTKYHDELTYHIHPKLKRRAELMDSDVLLSVRNLKQFFFFGSKIKNLKLKAVSNVSFDVMKGECFGIVGESGCGKTTTGRTIIKLYKPTSGSIYYRGYRIGAGSRWNEKEIKWTRIRYYEALEKYHTEKDALKAELKKDPSKAEEISAKIKELDANIARDREHMKSVLRVQRKKIRQIKFDMAHTPKKLMNEIQMIFQDPVDSLDPRMTVEDIIQEGLRIQGSWNKKENHKKVVEMLEKVGLVEEHASRYPHEFSGGQRQRIGIARALIMQPKLLICDEPISALDVSIRAQIINLLNDLKDEMGLTLIFIAHDLSVVKYFCDRIAVMYFGKMVELATSDELFKHPLHPYTRSLLSAIPKPNPLTEKDRVRILYKPWEVHDYSVDKPSLREVFKNHVVYCNNKEFEEYEKEIAEIDKK